MLAAALRIHNTIVVTIATATSEATPRPLRRQAR